MGLFGKSFKSKDTWSSGGTKRVRKKFSDGSSQTNTYRGGRLLNIRDTDKKGRSHDHHIGRGVLGPFKGSKR